MKPIFRSSAAFLLCLGLAGCLPNLDLFGANAPGNARVAYGVANGDTAGFDLGAFSSRHVSAAISGEGLQITISQSGRDRALQLTVAQPSAGMSCPLVSGSRFGTSPGVPCSLYYLQNTRPGAPPLEPAVVNGTLTLNEYTSERVSFMLEATLQSPAGGSFPVRASGESLIQRQ